MDQRIYALSAILAAWITQIVCLDFQARSCSHSGQESNSVLLQYNVTFCRNASSMVCSSKYNNTLTYTLANTTIEEPSILKWERSIVGLCDGEKTSLKIENCQPLWDEIGFNRSDDTSNVTALDTCKFKVLVIDLFTPTSPPPTPLPTNASSEDPTKPPKSRPNRRRNTTNNDRHFLFYFQFIVIPIALVLLVFIIYYLYKIEYANKNVKFYCVSEQFESAYEINQLI